MIQFADSEYNRSMRQYEEKCREAVAFNSSSRQQRFKAIEDNIVAEGVESLVEYEKTLQERWSQARCLAEFDGVSIGFAIAARARKRIETANTR